MVRATWFRAWDFSALAGGRSDLGTVFAIVLSAGLSIACLGGFCRQAQGSKHLVSVKELKLVCWY